jgi:hypothetical protein
MKMAFVPNLDLLKVWDEAEVVFNHPHSRGDFSDLKINPVVLVNFQ